MEWSRVPGSEDALDLARYTTIRRYKEACKNQGWRYRVWGTDPYVAMDKGTGLLPGSSPQSSKAIRLSPTRLWFAIVPLVINARQQHARSSEPW